MTTSVANDAAAAAGQVSPSGTADPGVLIVAYYYPPTNASGAQRPSRFAKYLPEFGLAPRIVAFAEDETGAPAENATYVPNGQTATAEAAARRAGLYQRIVLPYDQQRPWAPHAALAGEQLIREHDVRCLVSTSPPVATHYAAMAMKRRTGVPWIADFRDPYYGNPMRTSLRSRWTDSMGEKSVVRHADALIANTETLGEELRKRYPSRAKDVIVLMNGYDPDEPLGPLAVPERAQKTLAHIGALYEGRKPDVIVDSVLRLVRAGKLDPALCKLDFIGPYHPSLNIGDGAGGELIGLGAMDCPGSTLPREEANRRMAEADWLLLLDLNHLGATLQVPAKVFDYVRVERPILAFTSEGSPTQRLLEQSGLRQCCIDPRTPPPEIDRNVADFLTSTEGAGELSAEFQTKFEARNQVAQLANLIHEVRR